MGVAILILMAFGIFASPDLRSNPLLDILAALVLLGAIGLIYGRWLDVRSKQAMIDLERQNRKR